MVLWKSTCPMDDSPNEANVKLGGFPNEANGKLGDSPNEANGRMGNPPNEANVKLGNPPNEANPALRKVTKRSQWQSGSFPEGSQFRPSVFKGSRSAERAAPALGIG